MTLDPNKPHPFKPDLPNSAIWCWCGRSNSRYARRFHSPPFQDEGKPPLVANSAPVKTDLPAPVFADHSFAARQGRLRGLKKDLSFEEWLRAQIFNTPAVSTSSGGEPENTKETNMKLNLTITAPGAESILPLLAALRTVDGVKLEDITEVDQPPVYRSEPQKVAVGRIDMRRLLREATDERREVVLDYTTEAGVRHHERSVVPVSFEDDLLLATDKLRGHGLRSFKLDRMQQVTLR